MSDQQLVAEYNKGYAAGQRAHYEADLEIPLRDQMAMAALTGMISHYGSGDENSAAKYAYEFADSMIEARKK